MIELLIINSLIIWGVYTSFQDSMIFGRIGFRYLRGNEFFKAYIPEWIAKPLAICPICMSSVYGTLVFWFAYFTDLINYDYIIIVYICYVFALAGLNYLILTIISDE